LGVPIPHGANAILDRRKLTAYLLSDRHPVGQHKARVLRALGFRTDDAEHLAKDLLTIASTGRLVAAGETSFGTRYIAEGPVRSPTGRTVLLRTIWVTPRGTTTPRFVTAYPVRRKGT
jgi:ABC-type taurine transport system ATPase subunit